MNKEVKVLHRKQMMLFRELSLLNSEDLSPSQLKGMRDNVNKMIESVDSQIDNVRSYRNLLELNKIFGGK